VPGEVVATGESAAKTVSLSEALDTGFFRVELVP
jgi:hypothetical protein